MRHICLGIMIAVLFIGTPVLAAARNCDANAMIYCGAYSKDELVRKMNQGDGRNSAANIQGLFDRYEVKPSDVRSTSTVNGEVRKDGTVWVAGKKVATNAYSYGRQNMAGSTKQGSLFKRPTSVSFEINSLPAYVHMTRGKFDWAIIKACGNMVTATPMIVPAKKITPALSPTPAPIQPAPIIQQTVVQQVVHQKVVQNTVASAPKPQPKALPQTGPDGPIMQLVAGIAGMSTGVGLLIYSRQRLKKMLLRTA